MTDDRAYCDRHKQRISLSDGCPDCVPGPDCANGEQCCEEVTCTPNTCPWKQKGWQHTANCVKHYCAHDWDSGPLIEFDSGFTTSCACGLTAMGHDMRYGP